MITRFLLLCFILLTFLPAYAEEKVMVAVIEFQNRSKGAIKFNGSELAVWMAKELNETDEFKTCDRKVVSKIVEGASWNGERLSVEAESQLRELPASYALYGSLMDWHTSLDTTTPNPYSTGRFKDTTVPAAVVILALELVDLKTGESVKTFNVDGAAVTGKAGMGSPEVSDVERAKSLDELFEEAAQSALRRGVSLLTKKD
jgi:curli biogenesis system outer membrane secretion channel CsgG